MSEQYYVRIRGRIGGPFDESKLRVLIQRGQLSRMHEISDDGTAWVSASQLAHLFPKRSLERPAGSAERAIAPPQPSGSSLSARPAEPPSPPVAPKWYYSSHDGVKHGPLNWEQMQQAAIDGEVKRSSLVWSEGMAEWVTGEAVPGLIERNASRPGPIPWSELLPFALIANDGSWALAWVQCLAVAVLFPLLVLEYHGDGGVGLTSAATAFTLYFTLIWTAFFHWCISPQAISYWRLIGVWLMTATLGILVVMLLEVLLLPLFGESMAADTEASLMKRVVGWTVAVGLVEEVGKLLAVVAFTSRIQPENAARTCAFIGIVSGLAFGTVEAVVYTHHYAEVHSQAAESRDAAYGELLLLLMTRWISLPLLHAIWAGITGYFVGLSHNAGTNRWRWVFFGLAAASFLHGLYDVGASTPDMSWLSLLVAFLSLTLLVGYLRLEGSLTRQIASQ